jgi:XisH protein
VPRCDQNHSLVQRALEKDSTQIVVKIHDFLKCSNIEAWYKVFGEFFVRDFLAEQQYPHQILYMAVPDSAYKSLFQGVNKTPSTPKHITDMTLIHSLGIRLITYNLKEEILQWIPTLPLKASH